MKMLTLTLILISFSGLSQARSWNHNAHRNQHSDHDSGYFWGDVVERQHKQHRRVDRAVEKGQLTRRELKKLKRERKHLAKALKHYKRHDYLSHSNKREILNHLDHYSDQIRHLKHNDRYAHRGHQQHSYDNQHGYNNKRNRVDYNHRNNHNLSWANNNYSSGFYFRF